jgi:hypothetical protein
MFLAARPNDVVGLATDILNEPVRSGYPELGPSTGFLIKTFRNDTDPFYFLDNPMLLQVG